MAVVFSRPPKIGLRGVTRQIVVQTARDRARWNGLGEPLRFDRLRFFQFGRPGTPGPREGFETRSRGPSVAASSRMDSASAA